MLPYTTYNNIKERCTNAEVITVIQRHTDQGLLDTAHLTFLDLFELVDARVGDLIECEPKYAPLWRYIAVSIARDLCTGLLHCLCKNILHDITCSRVDQSLAYARKLMRSNIMKGTYPGYAEEYCLVINATHALAHTALKKMIEIVHLPGANPRVIALITETIRAGFSDTVLTTA